MHWRPSAPKQRREREMSLQIRIQGLRTVGALAAAAWWLGAPASAESPAAQRGLTFPRLHCAQCHSLDAVSESPLKIAPPFRNLHLKYPVESLRRPLSEGIIANHPTMP